MRTVGGAHRGLNLWLMQRASAVVMALYLPGFLVYALMAGPLDYAAWHGLFLPLAAKVSSLLFVGALLVHAWIGLREIFIDYVHPMTLRLPLLFLFGVLYLGCLAWAADILWGVQ
jgi:succinate dehydrogenase / fumarate reductase membrane anchor subunit